MRSGAKSSDSNLLSRSLSWWRRIRSWWTSTRPISITRTSSGGNGWKKARNQPSRQRRSPRRSACLQLYSATGSCSPLCLKPIRTNTQNASFSPSWWSSWMRPDPHGGTTTSFSSMGPATTPAREPRTICIGWRCHSWQLGHIAMTAAVWRDSLPTSKSASLMSWSLQPGKSR